MSSFYVFLHNWNLIITYIELKQKRQNCVIIIWRIKTVKLGWIGWTVMTKRLASDGPPEQQWALSAQ